MTHTGTRLKVLFVTPYLPGPPIFGGQRRMHGLMNALSREHEISVLSLVDATVDQAKGLEDAKSYCRNVVTVSDRRRLEGKKKRVLQLGSVFSRRSWEWELFVRPALQKALDRHFTEQAYDIVNCEFCYMACYDFHGARANGTERSRLVLDEHNVEYDVLRRSAATGGVERRVFNAVNWRKLRREELRAWNRVDGCTLTSQRDERLLASDAPGLRTRVIPNGVDVDYFRPRAEAPPAEPRTILFFGAINYFPNTDGALFFINEVMPRVTARYEGAKLRVVGPGAPPSITALQSRNVEIVGFVDDLRAEIERAAVVVAPLRIGGGTRLKILEAMAMGRPIVSTSIGAEGLDVTHGRDILLADTPQDFAREIGTVFDDAERGRELGAAARRTAEGHYSWRAAADKLGEFYRTLLKKEGGAA
jgi:glycosyltransferase involved in cell wall biosynthesis